MKKCSILLVIALLWAKNLAAQDSLAHYTLAQLDSIYFKKKATERMPYTLAMLQKGSKELDRQDTAFAKILFKMGTTYYFLRNKDSALVYYQKAADIQQVRIPQHRDYATSVNNIGFLYYEKGDYTTAERLFKQALQIRKDASIDKKPEYADNLGHLAFLYDRAMKPDLAEVYFKAAIRSKEESVGAKHPQYVAALLNLANWYERMGNQSAAEPLFKQALAIRKETLGEKHPDYAVVLGHLAVLYTRIGDYAAAEPLFKQTLAIRKEALGEKHPNYIAVWNDLGILYWSIGDYTAAEASYKQSLALQKALLGESHLSLAHSLNNLALLYSDIANYEAAESIYLEALSLQKAQIGEKDLNTANMLDNLGALYVSKGDYAKAEPLLRQSMQIRKELLGTTHVEYAGSLANLGALYEKKKNYALADSFFQACRTIQETLLSDNHPAYMRTMSRLANLHTVMSDYATAQTYFAQFLPVRFDYLDRQGAALGEKNKQDFFKKLGVQINDANHFAAFHRQHDSLLVLIQDGMLLTKGYALTGVSELLPMIKQLKDSTLQATYTAWTYNKQQLGKAYEMTLAERSQKGINIDSLQRLVNDQENTIMQGSIALRERLGYNKKRFYYNDLVKTLAKKEVAIDFVRVENPQKDTAWYYALVTQQGWAFPKYIPLCLESQLKPYADVLIQPDQENYISQPAMNRAVYELLIQPLEPYLKQKKYIHWAPIGLMNQVAMGTLQDKKGKMLGARFEIHQYSSLKDFIAKKQADGSTGSLEKSVLLVGDVAFDLEEKEHQNLVQNATEIELYASRSVLSDSTRGASRFARLVGTKVELEYLNTAFYSKQWTIEKLQERQALEERVCEYTGDKTPLVLHFATHGFFIPAKKQGEDNPLLRSGIALAGANRVWLGKKQIEGVEDGLWTAYEIANLDLHKAELVVLSACETARGQIDQNEGVLGLQRAFKIAGVDNMLLSLWQVPDKETVELMQAFYRYYLNGDAPSVALRKAQAEMRKKYPDPYFWAAFILIE